jgi:transcriptional regulator with XRE-family HTH domain
MLRSILTGQHDRFRETHRFLRGRRDKALMARFYPSRKLGAALREYRIAVGWTLGDAARHLECDRSKISRIENGERGIHSRDLTELLALYEVPPDARASLRGLASIPRGHPDAEVLDAIIEAEQACARRMKGKYSEVLWAGAVRSASGCCATRRAGCVISGL